MSTRQLVALERFSYNRRSLNPGDEFEAVSESDADLLVLAGRARVAEEKASAGKLKYKRRDMTAEQAQ